jgi:nitrogen regulatory protein PII
VPPIFGTTYFFGVQTVLLRLEADRLLPKVKCEVVLPDTRIQNAVEAIVRAARIKKIGDAKVFVSRIDQVVSIRTAERGESAI